MPDARDPGERTAVIRIPRVSRPPTLDDLLNGREPPGLARITEFRQQAPDDGSPVSLATTAFVGYDAEYLYALFVCKGDPAQVRARLSRRDDIASDDEVGLYLDTFRDRQHALSFYVNPLGIQADSVNTEGQGDDYSYDVVWRSEGRLTSDGYVVWMAIPFKSIRFPRAAVQTWGFGVARFIPGRNESSYWPYYTTRIEGFAQQLATLEGLEDISPGRNVQLIPYGAFGRSRFLDAPADADPAFRTDTDRRVGLDAKVILRDALTLDATVNPDFSQVESDDPQVTANRRFEVFFPEKRPFFLENADYFQTPENLLFSRRIANPEYGARLTGKAGRWLLGVMGIDDRAPGEQVPAGDARRGDRAWIGAVRVQRLLGKQSTVGVLATHYAFGGDAESVVSADARLKLTPNLVLTGQAVHSARDDGGGGRTTGSDFYAELAYSDLHTIARTTWVDRSPSFGTSLGFVPRVDIRLIQQELSYSWIPAAPVLKSFGPTLTMSRDWDHDGKLQDWLVDVGFRVELAGQTTATIVRTEALEVFEGLRFRKPSTLLTLFTEASKHVGVNASFSTGTRVNYFPPDGVPPFAADGRDLSLGLTLRPIARLKLDETYLFTHLGATGGNTTILDDHLFRSTVNFQFTRELSARAILDYTNARPDATLIDLEPAKTLTVDLLLTWLLRPGTALYAGYTERHENLVILPGPPPELGRIGSPSTQTGRQFFVKASYLVRF